MGINGLFSFLKKYSEKTEISNAVKGKRIAVDIFWFIHKSKGDLEKIKKMLDSYVLNSEKVLFVFDGKVSEERRPELKILKEKRQEQQKLIEELEQEVLKLERDEIKDNECDEIRKKELKKYIDDLRLQAWAPKGNYIELVKDLIKSWWGLDKCSLIVAPYEADLYFGELEESGRVDYIVSNDSDMLALCYKKIVKPCEGDEDGYVRIYKIETILKELKMRKDDWFEFITICRNYAKVSPSKYDILVPYSYWRVYRRRQ